MLDDLMMAAIPQGEDPEVMSILAEVCRLTDMGFAAVARVTEERWIAWQVIDRIDFGLKPGDELRIKTTICNDIREYGKAIVIDSVRDNPEWRTHPTPILYGFESYASFPITLVDGSFFGTLCAIDPEPHAINVASIIETLADYAGRVGEILSARGRSQ